MDEDDEKHFYTCELEGCLRCRRIEEKDEKEFWKEFHDNT